MKNLFHRLRVWLAEKREAARRWAIHKLGGYTSQISVPLPLRPVELRPRIAEIRNFGCCFQYRPGDNEAALVNKMALDITRKLLEEKVFEYSEAAGLRDGTVLCRMSLRVVMPEKKEETPC